MKGPGSQYSNPSAIHARPKVTRYFRPLAVQKSRLFFITCTMQGTRQQQLPTRFILFDKKEATPPAP